MASLPYLLLLLSTALTSPLSICFAESRKELRNKEANPIILAQSEASIRHNRIDPSRVITLSWHPRVFLYKGFLTDEECDHLISLGQGTKESSLGKGDDGSGEIAKNRLLRSSESLSMMGDNIIARIEERISAWTFLPRGYSSSLQVIHFEVEDAKQKFDYLGNKSTSNSSVPLLATLVLYLSNVTHGGEIIFPQSEPNNKISSDCMTSSTSNLLRPIKGNAILFFNVHPNTSPDKSSNHATRCPVLKGEMWCATKVFLVGLVDGGKSLVASDGSECTDEDENCPAWAAIGECQRNPVFMVGSPDYYGTCRKSCNAC